eukprot:TRINITY_DN15008_c0_g1_i2.p2 TRINITY_DN15008_c0_g1~~TRINITY_DN15008_c0_g1_i2.p2  ORF type:complete len:140 (+),score=20.57 TRINITY_DN15008_c0_g1_i2:204-623(+)
MKKVMMKSMLFEKKKLKIKAVSKVKYWCQEINLIKIVKKLLQVKNKQITWNFNTLELVQKQAKMLLILLKAQLKIFQNLKQLNKKIDGLIQNLPPDHSKGRLFNQLNQNKKQMGKQNNQKIVADYLYQQFSKCIFQINS